MSIKKFVHKILVLLSAFSLFWIIAGSVIEFHQKYVFYNHVELWQAVTCISNKDLKKSIQLVDKDLHTGMDFSHFKSEEINDSELIILLTGMQINFAEYHYNLITAKYRPDLVFRGPPRA